MNLAKIATAIVFTGLAASAFAGPDWDVIQRARLAAVHQASATAAQAQAEDQAMNCMQMMRQMSASDMHLQSIGNAVGSHGATNSGSDPASNRTWGNSLASVVGERSPYLDGSRIEQRDVFTDGAMTLAGMDRTGVSAPPARGRDPYMDGARASGDLSQA